MPECLALRRSVKPLSVVISIRSSTSANVHNSASGSPLLPGAANVLHVMTEFPEASDGHQGNVLVYQKAYSAVHCHH